ncbi:transcription-repair coupling factor [Haploplasma axanthum]|uniref:Transcription-repair-coupling factor n=1 Tax=Haploplasma axanthum TaxID=29552 RepID=A0A449BBD2_HAPAX|nr:transcription-repair coupling factor [Haploplasma axanthum]VEU79691.1 excinuclease ABC subunit B [Haploplasma axanthum]
MKKIKNYIIEKLNLGNKYYQKTNDYFNAYMIKEDYLNSDKTIFVVLPNLYEAQKYYDYLNQIIESDYVLFYPVDQILTTIMALGSHEFQSERLYTIKKLLSKDKFIVVTTLDGILMRQLKPNDYKNSILTLKVNDEYNIDSLVNYLVNSGYVHEYTVENPGTFSVRGGIVDIFTRDNTNPIRLDFFDNLLESIKIFDVETQRSFGTINEIEIAPLHELFYTSKMKDDAIKRINKHFEKFTLSSKEQQRLNIDIEKISNRTNLSMLNIYIPFFNVEETSILDFSDNKKIYVIDEYKMITNENQKADDLETYAHTMDGKAFLSLGYLIDYKKQINKSDINIDNLGILHKDAYSLDVMDVNNYRGNLAMLYFDLVNTFKGYKLFLNDNTNSKEVREIKSYLKDKAYEDYEFIDEDIIGSFVINEEKIIYLNEESVFGNKKSRRAKYRSVLNQSTKIRHVEELEVGDYVVHYEFGIGKYMGLKTMDLSGIKRDYLYIIYKDNESLYVPMEQIDLILKYSSNDGVVPQLSKMGGRQWKNTKAAVKKKIKDLSDRLLKLYALREEAVGYAYSSDNETQIEFENDFKYELTKDQAKSIKRVKEEMMKPKPMDVLIIGDVGFGKTEVALRAAFKAVLDGKQVLYLVPTTVLARQHYYTFKERFEKFGATVELMSRFVSKKQQTETIKNLKKGFVDVVIGTHRLLSKDIEFANLGLLVIDEEQRFGVIHKERIKEIKVNVDTLTLSATPIPRTLQMTMLGLKDLETIETPPLNRYPVQTYVVRREDALVKEAIRREIARGGQVFYLYNKVEDMELMVLKIQKLVPEAKIVFGHGKMSKDQLERTISEFIDHEYDILVSTTIIETGIDIPNTNTLIIHDADRLGLSQLYQIRGRVGRSDKIAYAYLMYDGYKDLSDEAYKRLRTLEDFTELGSGYKIAMKDLSIRGAGDILGSEQSGFIDSVGLEMYLQLLDEVLNDKEELKPLEEVTDVYANRSIDKEYIDEDSVRIEIHKKVSKLNNLNDLNDLKEELEDRFGTLNVDLLTYMYEKLLKKLFYRIGVYKVSHSKGAVLLVINKEKSNEIDGVKLFEVSNKFKYKVNLGYLKDEIQIKVDYPNASEHWIYIVVRLLEAYYEGINKNNQLMFKEEKK